MHRAAHQVLDRPAIFVDPVALAIVGAEVAEIEREPRHQLLPARSLRAFMAARSRVAEDALAVAVTERRVSQYVVLGAGFDTFAFRNPFARLKVFEVDHPATQQHKRERTAEAGLATPDGLTYVAIDFEREELDVVLSRSGFDMSRPAFFSWLGVVPYLPLAAIEKTLRFIASGNESREVVFDYAVDPALLPALERAAVHALAKRVAAAGEPFRTYLRPPELSALLHEYGFEFVNQVTPDEINARYFADRDDGLRVRGSAARIVNARHSGADAAR
jgi:methyltransferase (TIGR00027 family)